MKEAPAIPSNWAYDLFGYLLPGCLILAAVGKFTRLGHEIFAGRWTSGKAHEVALLLGLAYILGHLVAAMSSWTLEKRILREVLGYPTARMFPLGPGRPSTWWRNAWQGFLRFLFPGYFRSYTVHFRGEVDRRFKATFNFEGDDDHDRFWVIWEWVALNHPVAHRRATHFLDLYGFSRNTSFACLMVASLALFPGALCPVAMVWWLTGWLFAALVLFSNYTKFMRRHGR